MKNKNKIIDSSIDYFIGVWENAISYYNDNVNSFTYMNSKLSVNQVFHFSILIILLMMIIAHT